jgi:Fe-S cluster assembly iron-binding protein IscA
MALDEPKTDDLVVERGVYNVVLDPQIIGMIREKGGLDIDYVEEEYRKGYMVKLKETGAGCDTGGCSC